MLAKKEREDPFLTQPRLNLRRLASCLDLSIRPFTCQSLVSDTDALCHGLFVCFYCYFQSGAVLTRLPHFSFLTFFSLPPLPLFPALVRVSLRVAAGGFWSLTPDAFATPAPASEAPAAAAEGAAAAATPAPAANAGAGG